MDAQCIKHGMYKDIKMFNKTLDSMLYLRKGTADLEITLKYEHHEESFDITFHEKELRDEIVEMLRENGTTLNEKLDKLLEVQKSQNKLLIENRKNDFEHNKREIEKLNERVTQTRWAMGPLNPRQLEDEQYELTKDFLVKNNLEFSNYEDEFNAKEDIEEALRELDLKDFEDIWDRKI